jgi:hypothetical protein
MPAALITFPHFSVSSTIYFLKSAGDMGVGSTTSLASRLRLVKIAARVVEMKTMIRVHLPTSCPAQHILHYALGRIPRLVC